MGVYHGNSYFTIDVHEKRSYTIVSLGAAVSRIKNDFLKDLDMYLPLLEHQNSIISDDKIVRNFLEQNEWNFYKQEFSKVLFVF